MKAIVLDMDGTIADTYNVPQWLTMLENKNAAPYIVAKPIGDNEKINACLALLQGYGYVVEVVSWLCKDSNNKQFDNATRRAKKQWLKKYYPAIDPRNVHIVKHGTNKWRVSKCKGGILFDDEANNVEQWNKQTSSGRAIQIEGVKTLLETLEAIAEQELTKREDKQNLQR